MRITFTELLCIRLSDGAGDIEKRTLTPAQVPMERNRVTEPNRGRNNLPDVPTVSNLDFFD